jgi:hypothetical protein
VFGLRRVPGLRREEVASVLGALRLDEAERAHLFDLARASQPAARSRRRVSTQIVRPSVQWMLDSMTGAAAVAENGRLDALVGELELSFNRLEVSADAGQMIVAYTPEPGSRSAEAFALLGSWAATEKRSARATTPDKPRQCWVTSTES